MSSASSQVGQDSYWLADHPVLGALRARREDGSTPGNRDDNLRIGLAVEGGGMRGILSCAMLAALKDENFSNAFDEVYGNSSGSVNGAYFLSGSDAAECLSIYFDDLASRNFVNWRRVLRGGPFFDVDYAFNDVFGAAKPLEYVRVLSSPTPLHVAITLVDSCETVVPSVFHHESDLRAALRAGAWLPLATRGTADFRGQRGIDGGVLIAHPTRIALAEGCTHVLSLSTKVLDRRPIKPGLLQRVVAQRLNRLHPGLGDGFLQSLVVDASDRSRWHQLRTSPGDGPFVLDLGPMRGDVLPLRHDTDQGRLFFAARKAYSRMLQALRGEAVRVIPRLEATPSRLRPLEAEDVRGADAPASLR